MSRRPTVFDLFAGAGGLGLGFEQAGFDVVTSVELDPIHAAVHSYNFPRCATICADATEITGQEILDRAGTSIDVVVGGAPCQGFSLIGQRALDDPRNQLVKHFLRLVIEIQPQAFVLENVKGLTVGKHKGFLDEIVKESEAAGYNVELPWQVLNAKNYGVPQDRQRLFLIGVKKGLPLPGYPDQIDDELRVTCEDALGDIPDAESFGTLVDADTVKTTRFGDPSSYAAEMRCVSRESWRYGYQRVWDPALLTSSMRTGHTEISRIRFSETEEGTVEPISRFYKLSRKGVSNTLRAGTDSARGAFTSPRPIHYKYNRCITVREMARLHGFPDWFRFHPTKWHGARQIGNAVPPPLARAVGDQILRETLGLEPKMPAEILKLDSEDLLKFDMKGASAYWGIDVPIGKRDRKSGAKKRKQEDIERERLAG
jgi:DNA (cytosine-5)-methyltransferase 1